MRERNWRESPSALSRAIRRATSGLFFFEHVRLYEYLHTHEYVSCIYFYTHVYIYLYMYVACIHVFYIHLACIHVSLISYVHIFIHVCSMYIFIHVCSMYPCFLYASSMYTCFTHIVCIRLHKCRYTASKRERGRAGD